MENFTEDTKFKIDELGIERKISEVFISSDEHLGHTNIIKYAERSYHNVWEMNEDIISRHNEIVPAQNSLWICLGDFAFVRGNTTDSLTEQLHQFVLRFHGASKILLMGNHDRQRIGQYLKAGFDYVIPREQAIHCSVNKFKFLMRHRPYKFNEFKQEVRNRTELDPQSKLEQAERISRIMIYDKSNSDALQEDIMRINENIICGHVHQLYRRYANGNVVNAGVDAWDMKPVALSKILELMDE